MAPRTPLARITAVAAGFCVCSSLLLADSHGVDFDASVDFRTVTTFVLHPGVVHSKKPELDNRLFVQQLDDTIRAALLARGLKEVVNQPGVVVDVSVAGVDASRSVRHPGTRAGGVVFPGSGIQREEYAEGTLVIDMSQNGALIWRGTYHDEERSSPTLARRFPTDAKTLLADFPPKRK